MSSQRRPKQRPRPRSPASMYVFDLVPPKSPKPLVTLEKTHGSKDLYRRQPSDLEADVSLSSISSKSGSIAGPSILKGLRRKLSSSGSSKKNGFVCKEVGESDIPPVPQAPPIADDWIRVDIIPFSVVSKPADRPTTSPTVSHATSNYTDAPPQKQPLEPRRHPPPCLHIPSTGTTRPRQLPIPPKSPAIPSIHARQDRGPFPQAGSGASRHLTSRSRTEPVPSSSRRIMSTSKSLPLLPSPYGPISESPLPSVFAPILEDSELTLSPITSSYPAPETYSSPPPSSARLPSLTPVRPIPRHSKSSSIPHPTAFRPLPVPPGSSRPSTGRARIAVSGHSPKGSLGRRETSWSGEWNSSSLDDVIDRLRSLK